MKVRSMKLKEAHTAKSGGAAFCSVLWDQKAKHLITASSSDVAICIHDSLFPSLAPKTLRHHRDGVTALALSPNSTCLASGSVDHSVKLYKYPGGEFERNITRFTLPIRSLAFNKSGSMLAAAGDDEGIKLINTFDGTIARVLKGHKGSITGLAFDPNGEYLASLDSTGTVILWELQSGKIIHNLKGIAPDTGLDVSTMNVLCWSPDGETLAVPGLKNDVVMYDRDTAEKVLSLRGDHIQPICFLCWSPNGKYIASSGLDRQVLIWDVDRKQDIDRQKFDERVCCMAWKPTGNALAVIDIMGKYGIWDNVIPSSMKSPTEDIPVKSKSNGVVYFDEEDPENSASENSSDVGGNSNQESEPPSRKRSRKQSLSEENSGEDGGEEIVSYPKVDTNKKRNRPSKENLDSVNMGFRGTMVTSKAKMQEPFQPGSTPVQPGKRRFLCYNMLGCITSIEHDGYSHIEIDFHDTGSTPRVPSMTDHFGFTMAALNESGSIFANPCKGENNMSTLMYRPFSSWANNSEWSMRFEGEEVKVVALGSAWVAAVTSFNYLRIFSEGGLQRDVFSLDGPVVTASGFKDKLAVVTHATDGLLSNDQKLEFMVFNIPRGTLLLQGRLPLSPGSSLSWFGFSEEGQLCSYDSKGVLRSYTSKFGGRWIPLFSATKEKSDENYWVTGLNASKVFCVVCKKPEDFPQVMPKPVLTPLNLSFPLASSDLGGSEAHEKEFMMNNLRLYEIQRTMDEMASVGLDTTSLDDDAFNFEAAQDKCILRLIAACCNSDKLVRATELVKLLTLEKSMRGAVKLVTAMKLPNLAERFSSILEERLLEEAKKAMETNIKENSVAPVTADALPNRSKAPTHTEALNAVTMSSSPKLSVPSFLRKDKTQERAKAGTSKTAMVNENLKVKQTGEETSDKVGKVVQQTSHPYDPSTKSSNKNGLNKSETSLGQSNRPSNPFLKSETSLEQSNRPSNPFLKAIIK
ncbi:WD repeat and HMG-box DNA-binding protein 1-like [Glycine soja]|uniref:WD repeat and HMG-box DNA-binding protein 1 n=2 Tax=Glycine soja TaxID=3848 RepID=A0A445KCQ5_GLYSO|nr:WD repeat and HMG-box DNA-binding protein 1-like [Glycine soja]RZC08509.1 WD repeat and HMG-box DNA-binding protein 1 [Glycine soja]